MKTENNVATGGFMMKTVNNVAKMITDDYNAELESCKKGIKYCKEKIAEAETSEADDKWVIKEYQAVIEDDKKRIAEIKQTLLNIKELEVLNGQIS